MRSKGFGTVLIVIVLVGIVLLSGLGFFVVRSRFGPMGSGKEVEQVRKENQTSVPTTVVPIEDVDTSSDIQKAMDRGTIKYVDFPNCFRGGWGPGPNRVDSYPTLLWATTNCPVYFLKPFENAEVYSILENDNRLAFRMQGTGESVDSYIFTKAKPPVNNYEYRDFSTSTYEELSTVNVIIEGKIFVGSIARENYCLRLSDDKDAPCEAKETNTVLIVQLPTGQWLEIKGAAIESYLDKPTPLELVPVVKRDDGKVHIPPTG